MQTMVFTTESYVRAHGLRRPWPDPSVLRYFGDIELEQGEVPHGRFLFTLRMPPHKNGLKGDSIPEWQITLRNGATHLTLHSQTNPGPVPGWSHNSIAIDIREFLMWVEACETIEIAFEPVCT